MRPQIWRQRPSLISTHGHAQPLPHSPYEHHPAGEGAQQEALHPLHDAGRAPLHSVGIGPDGGLQQGIFEPAGDFPNKGGNTLPQKVNQKRHELI